MCLRLGFPHPRYLLPYLTAKDIAEWKAFSRLEPFGELEEEYRFGMLAAVSSEPNRNPKIVTNPFKPWDFFPRCKPNEVKEEEKLIEEEEGEEDPEALEALNMEFALMLGQPVEEGNNGSKPTS